LLLDFLQLLPHAFADRHASHRVMTFPILPADMRETKKVERLRFAFPSSFPALFGEPPELDQARLVWMKFQPKLPQPHPEILQKTNRIRPMLETQDGSCRKFDLTTYIADYRYVFIVYRAPRTAQEKLPGNRTLKSQKRRGQVEFV
jgi:hypothetical protein